MNQDIARYLDLGTWIGRGQAFGMVANQSMAAEAQCLRQIRDSDAYKALDLKWDEFCTEYVGLTRQRVDGLIQNLEEFGATYFRLSEIVRISPGTYRQIASRIEGEEIEIEGKMVPIVPETPCAFARPSNVCAPSCRKRKNGCYPPVAASEA